MNGEEAWHVPLDINQQPLLDCVQALRSHKTTRITLRPTLAHSADVVHITAQRQNALNRDARPRRTWWQCHQALQVRHWYSSLSPSSPGSSSSRLTPNTEIRVQLATTLAIPTRTSNAFTTLRSRPTQLTQSPGQSTAGKTTSTTINAS